MRCIAIIPARMGASRFPGKPLHQISGIPMIGHCYFRALMAKNVDFIYVATCDEDIAEYVRSIGGIPVMTSSAHNRATDRTAEAMLKIEKETGKQADIVIMIQGDEPLILPETITETLKHFDDPAVKTVNIMSRLRTKEAFEDKNNVKVVVNQSNDALYFSREAIPSSWKSLGHIPMYMQVGVIAFRRDELIRFNNMPETRLEQIESVDMNRILETGGKIRMVPTEALTIGVDTREEADEVERILVGDPIFAQYAKP